jgi:hypothetical protein
LQQTNLYKRAQALRPADIMLSCLGFKLSIKNRPGTSLIRRLDQS